MTPLGKCEFAEYPSPLVSNISKPRAPRAEYYKFCKKQWFLHVFHTDINSFQIKNNQNTYHSNSLPIKIILIPTSAFIFSMSEYFSSTFQVFLLFIDGCCLTTLDFWNWLGKSSSLRKLWMHVCCKILDCPLDIWRKALNSFMMKLKFIQFGCAQPKPWTQVNLKVNLYFLKKEVTQYLSMKALKDIYEIDFFWWNLILHNWNDV